MDSSEFTSGESKGKTSLITNSLAPRSSKMGCFDLEDLTLSPTVWNTLRALLKVRVTILLRDIQRLYLMIFLPLGKDLIVTGFCAHFGQSLGQILFRTQSGSVQNLIRSCSDFDQIMTRFCPDSSQILSKLCPSSKKTLRRF